MSKFNIEGKTSYKITYIYGGESKNGSGYTFLRIEAEPYGKQKYGDKLKINVWGTDLTNEFKVDDYISINGLISIGEDFSQDKNDPNKVYRNIYIECHSEQIQKVEKGETETASKETTKLDPIEDDDLPF